MTEWFEEEWVREELGEDWINRFKAQVLPLMREYERIKDRIDETREIDVKIKQEVGYTVGTYYYRDYPIGLEGITESEWLRRWDDWLNIDERMEELDINAFVIYYNRLLELYRTHRRVRFVYSNKAKEELREFNLKPAEFFRFLPTEKG